MKRSWGDPLVIGAGLLGGLVAGNLTQLTQINSMFKVLIVHDPGSYGVAVLVVTAMLPMLVPALRRWGWFVAAAGTLVVVVDPSLVIRPRVNDYTPYDGPYGQRAVILAIVAGLILGGALLSVGVGTAGERVATAGGLAIGFVAGASQPLAAIVIPGLEPAGPYAVSLGLFVATGIVFGLRTRAVSTSDGSWWAGPLDLAVVGSVGGLATYVAIVPHSTDIFSMPWWWWSSGLWWLVGGLIVVVLFMVAMAHAGAAGGQWVMVGAALAASFPALLGLGPFGARVEARSGLQALILAVVAVATALGALAAGRIERVPWDAIALALLAVPLFVIPQDSIKLYGPSGRTQLADTLAVITFGLAGFATAAALTRLARLSARPDVGAGAWRCVAIGLAAAILTSQAVYQPASRPDAFGGYSLLAPWEWSAFAAVVIVILAFVRRPARAQVLVEAPL
jgi:hypothetical protein